MAQKKLKLEDCLILNSEIKNLHTEKDLSFSVKYELSKLSDELEPIVKNFNKQKDDIVKKFGVPIDPKDEKKGFTLRDAPKSDEALKAIEDLLEKEETVKYKLSFDDFKDLKTENSYVKLMKLF